MKNGSKILKGMGYCIDIFKIRLLYRVVHNIHISLVRYFSKYAFFYTIFLSPQGLCVDVQPDVIIDSATENSVSMAISAHNKKCHHFVPISRAFRSILRQS